MMMAARSRVAGLTRESYVQLVLTTLWENLPQVIGGGLLFSLCCGPAFLLFSLGFLAPTVVVAVVTVAPAWCALLAVADAIVLGNRVGFTLFWRSLWRYGRIAALLSMLFAFPLLIMLTTLPMLRLEPVPLVVWLGLAADLFILALAAALLLYAFPLLLEHATTLPALLRTALFLAGVHPFNTVGLLAMGLLGGFLVAYVSWGLLLLLPAVGALFIVANYQLVQNTLQSQVE